MYLLSGDSTGWIRRGEGISASGSPPAFDGGSGFEVFRSEAGGGVFACLWEGSRAFPRVMPD